MRTMEEEADCMRRGETTKQTLWEAGMPYFAIEAVAAMADGMPEVFARMIMLGVSRETVDKKAADIFNRSVSSEEADAQAGKDK